MLNFLKDCGISDDVVKDLEYTYSPENIYNLDSNEFEVIKIIEYFRKIGIEYIDELLVHNLEIFLCKFNYIVDKFNRYEIDQVVKMINDDYMLINNIIF